LKEIYKLKASAARATVIAAADLSRNTDSPYKSYVTLICLIKERRFDIASQWLESLEAANAHTKLARQEALDLFELVAVLWAQRELVEETLDRDQAQLLKRLFVYLGGSRFFYDAARKPEAAVSLASYASTDYASPRQIEILFRRSWWGEGESRPHEIGTRLVNAFEQGGWSAALHGPDDSEGVVSGIRPDSILFLDLDFIGIAECSMIIDRLPASVQTIGYVSDYHYFRQTLDFAKVKNLASGLSLFWTSTEDPAQHPELLTLTNWTDFPLPLGIKEVSRQKAISNRSAASNQPLFVGSIERTCLPRIIYLADSIVEGQMRFDISSHLIDNLSAEASYERYLDRITQSKINLNFGGRYNGTTIRTGRIIETIATSGLLVQDHCPLSKRWFIEGEHFVGFHDEHDLPHKLEGLRSNPQQVLKISSEGCKYYEQHYTPQSLVRHISAFF